MAHNDPHVALIILTTHVGGGGGGGLARSGSEAVHCRSSTAHCPQAGGGGGWCKNFFGQIFVFRRLWRQHPFLHKTKGPAQKPISPTAPSFGGRPYPPPPAPQSNFQVALLSTGSCRHIGPFGTVASGGGGGMDVPRWIGSPWGCF